MKQHLAIFDISPFIYTGMKSEEGRSKNQYGFPMGGISYFLRELTVELMHYRDVLVTFDSRSFRKDVYEHYKGQRKSDGDRVAVSMQVDYLFNVLQEINIPCYKAEGMEADDLVFSAVEALKNEYSMISIFSSDYDLTHNVDDTVKFISANRNVNNINVRNFRDGVERGKKIMLNTISAYHAFCGCDSDNFPAFKGENGVTGWQLYEAFCEFMRLRSRDLHKNPLAVEAFVKNAGQLGFDLSENDIEFLLRNIKLAFPVKTEGISYVGRSYQNIDMDLYARLLSHCNDRGSLRACRKQFHPMTEREKEFFRSEGKKLSTGEYAVDNNLPVNDDTIESEILSFSLDDSRSF